MPYTPQYAIRNFDDACHVAGRMSAIGPMLLDIGHDTWLTCNDYPTGSYPSGIQWCAIVHHNTPIITYRRREWRVFCDSHVSTSTLARFKAHLPPEIAENVCLERDPHRYYFPHVPGYRRAWRSDVNGRQSIDDLNRSDRGCVYGRCVLTYIKET